VSPAATVPSPPVIVLEDLKRTYASGSVRVRALRGISLTVERGDYVAVMGPSGSGKSTLLNILGCLDVPTSGRYLLDGVDVSHLDEDELSLLRNRKIGFIFQSFNLVPRTTALVNVELPLVYAGLRRRERHRRAVAALTALGLGDRMGHLPSQLSGGQQQRVAVARAIATSPAMILADEPTGNLDSGSQAELLAVFDQLNATGRTIVMITHEHDVAEHAKRVVQMLDGHVVEDHREAPVLGPPPRLRAEVAV
jgi:putative ABC transport system ATP-binding protein